MKILWCVVSISAKFQSVGNPVPLEDRDIIAIGPNNDKSHLHVDNIGTNRAVNFRHILETGDAGSDWNGQIGYNQRIDWDSDDAYTRTISDTTDTVIQKIQQDPELSALLEKDSWSREDRIQWERGVSTIVSDEIDQTPGLDSYRIESSLEERVNDSGSNLAVDGRTTLVNDLSSDIENGTARIEFDCETMAITEGSILQRVEDAMLPAEADEGDYKQASSYFYAGGTVLYINPDDSIQDAGGHAFIVSSATGSVIEATSEASNLDITYKQAADDYSFEGFVSGEPFVHSEVAYATELNEERANQVDDNYNDIPFEAHIDAAREHANSIKDAVVQMENQPEVQALYEFSKIQEVRPLTALEADSATDMIENSELSEQFDTILNEQYAYGSRLHSLYEMAKDDPEQLGQLRGFIQESEAVFEDVNSLPVEAWNDPNGGGMQTLEEVNAASLKDINSQIDERLPAADFKLPPLEFKTDNVAP